jgi:hypothetical protein
MKDFTKACVIVSKTISIEFKLTHDENCLNNN